MLNIIGLLIIVLAIAIAVYVRSAPVPAKPVSFADLKLKTRPNQHLFCPTDYCPQSRPHGLAGAYPLDHQRLLDMISEVALSFPRTSLLKVPEAPAGQLSFVERSRLMAYPDIITVEAIDLGEGKSTLAIYSRSVFGRSDLGVNKRRVARWLARLDERIKARGGS